MRIIQEIKDLIKIVEESKINELELSYIWGTKILIKKNNKNYFNQDTEVIETKIEEEKEYSIRSGYVGSFYRSEEIKENIDIQKGQIVGYIDSMKIKNEIKSEYEGVIKKIIENGPVEYGTILCLIKPTY